jgi:hypothetical protein
MDLIVNKKMVEKSYFDFDKISREEEIENIDNSSSSENEYFNSNILREFIRRAEKYKNDIDAESPEILSRGTEVRFFCDPEANIPNVRFVNEDYALHYTMEVMTDKLCEHPKYAKRKKLPKQKTATVCYPLEENKINEEENKFKLKILSLPDDSFIFPEPQPRVNKDLLLRIVLLRNFIFL